MFKCVDKRYIVQSNDVIIAREKCKLSQTKFAALCGWSPQYQWQLENNKVPSIKEKCKSIIERVLNENSN